MNKYTLKIKCLSAVCPASGESWGGVLDNDVVYDDIGIPFIPAKRIKGLLVESAIDVCHALYNHKSDVEYLFNLFGLQGHENAAPIIIDDAKIENYNERRAWFAWAQQAVPEVASPMQVLALFTTTRAQTAIAIATEKEKDDEGNDKKQLAGGVAKPHSLRIQRVLKRELIFESDIIIQNKVDDSKINYESLLVMAAAATKHLGLNRNRGMGDIEMKIYKNDAPIDINQIIAQEVQHG